jgi:penicillin-binding protein 2
LQLFKKRKKYDIEFEEVFAESLNVSAFKLETLEGSLNRSISSHIFFRAKVFTFFIFIFFVLRIGYLQILQGTTFFKKSIENSLERYPLIAPRGDIVDIQGIRLAWTEETLSSLGETIFARKYIEKPGFAHVLGYVEYPAKDEKGVFWRDTFHGKDGVERVFDDELKGVNGSIVAEITAKGEVQNDNIIDTPKKGETITLSIDSRVQEKFSEILSMYAEKGSFSGAAGVVMDIHTGDILALTSYPEFSPDILSQNKDKEILKGYFTSERRPLINRVIGGIYTPGSIVKPFVGLTALSEKIIEPSKKILSTGQITIPNPYNPKLPSVFKDNKAHGWVDMVQALAISSNVYFYEIGGGYKDQPGLGISRIHDGLALFGIGEKTGLFLGREVDGTIPSVEWKQKTFKNDQVWRVGDTYHTAIGQYGFQVSPIQMVRAVAGLSNGSYLVTPRISSRFSEQRTPITVDKNSLSVIHEGMRKVVTEGTGRAMDVPGVQVAAKSGTAQLGKNKEFNHSWVVGFFPYEKPRYAFTVLMDKGLKNNGISASYVMRDFLIWMRDNTPQYIE